MSNPGTFRKRAGARAIAGAAVAIMASAAGAADVSYTAETASTAKRQGAVTAGNVAWQCDGVRCIGIGPWATPPVGVCASLVREVGTLRTFAQYSSGEVAACNAAANVGAPHAPKAAPPAKNAPAKPPPGSGRA
jgi:hypothetical protein